MSPVPPSRSAGEPAGLRNLLAELFPGAKVVRTRALRADEAAATRAEGGGDGGSSGQEGRGGEVAKVGGYGLPIEIVLREADGRERHLVWHTASANEYGHDRRSDRAQELLLAFDTFGRIPGHVEALDVGAVLPEGRLVSLGRTGEFYLLTSFAPGRPYAEDLRRIAAEGVATPLDLERAAALASYLVELHREPGDGGPASYRRAVRDLVGHGEGIFGIVDGYGVDVPAASPVRLREIERRALEWRWRLRGREGRLRRTHGDFHPFNILFEDRGAEVRVLDAARGCQGDPADDVACLALNYVFFALEAPAAWREGLAPLWRRFWRDYLRGSLDDGLLAAAPPFIAWRGLVMASPGFYPALSARARDRLLTLVEEVLMSDVFDPAWADEVFA